MPSYSYILGGGPFTGGGIDALGGLAHEPDHEGYGLARVIAQYVDAERLRAILAVLLRGDATIGAGPLAPTGVQSAEDLAWALYTERGLVAVEGGGPAVGAQLDDLGRILLAPRRAAWMADDNAYRAFLFAVAMVYQSDGTASDLYAIVDAIGDCDHVALREAWPAFVELYLGSTQYTVELVHLLRRAKPGGAGLHVISTTADWVDVHRWSGTHATEEATTTYGWGSVHDPAIPGGEWASCYAQDPMR